MKWITCRPRTAARASEGLQSFVDDPLQFEPETQSKYSTFGWILVSAAVEAASGEPFFAFMRTHIFEPLGMADTTSDSPTEPIPDQATFYYPRLSGDPSFGPELATTVDYSCFAGAGGFVSTPSDLVRFGMAVQGRLRQGSPPPPRLRRTSRRPRRQAAAAIHRQKAPDITDVGIGRGDRVRPRLDVETVPSRASPRGWRVMPVGRCWVAPRRS